MSKFTKEQIQQIVIDAMSNNASDIYHQYIERLNELDDEQRNNPLAREMTAIALAQSNMALVITDVIDQLLNQ